MWTEHDGEIPVQKVNNNALSLGKEVEKIADNYDELSKNYDECLKQRQSKRLKTY